MKDLKRIRYWTMSSWNKLSAPAYNLKVYNVIDNDLQNKVFELLDCQEYHFQIGDLIQDFEANQGYNYKAGFNGRSSGYLVLYPAKGNSLEDDDVPEDVLKDFEQLAIDIVNATECMAKNFEVVEEEYQVTNKRKVLKEVA